MEASIEYWCIFNRKNNNKRLFKVVLNAPTDLLAAVMHVSTVAYKDHDLNMLSSLSLRRLGWRAGRALYMRSRGEERFGDIKRNGEAFLQRCMLEATLSENIVTVFDIGANQGEWTKSLLSEASELRLGHERLVVHAFEPVPSTAEMFRNIIATGNSDPCVTLHCKAMSDQSGTAEIAIYGDGAGTNSLHFSNTGRNQESQIKVQLDTLTSFFDHHEIAHAQMVKCDTEGHDAKVIIGAQPLLAAGLIDLLQFEYNHRWIFARTYLKDVFELIEGLPYTVVRVGEDRVLAFEEWHPELERYFQSNYVLVHDRAREWFPTIRGKFDNSNTYA